MARTRKSAPIEINKFTGGLITDASPLTVPDNFSLAEENMVLNIDGSRNRRLGMNYEDNHSEVTTSVANADVNSVAVSTFKWENAGGVVDKSLSVVQFGNEIKIFDLDTLPISGSLVYTRLFSGIDTGIQFSYAVVDGILVIANGQKNPFQLTYTAPSTFTETSVTLVIRDFFGVEDRDNGIDLYDGSYIQRRPTLLTLPHVYNLRNQTWGIPRVIGAHNTNTTPSASDPITEFGYTANAFPSNSDSVNEALYADTTNTSNRTIERFWADDLYKNPLGTTKAASGYFIIDALDRGASRVSNNNVNRGLYPALLHDVTGLPTDRTPGGPSVLGSYAGRVWYGGFSGEVIGADALSPRMSSYILFSKVVDNPSDIYKCYQEGDPTSLNAPDIVDTDGGYIRINEAYGIRKLVNLGDSLFIIATNGVWRIVGGVDKGFTATSYIVEKVSDRGCTNSESLIVVDNTIMFWSDDAIYHVKQDQFGGWGAQNISFGRIQNLFDGISIEQKRAASGSYDSYERKARWLYNTRLNDDGDVMELVLDISLQAFYMNRIKSVNELIPRPVALMVGNPYQIVTTTEDIVIDGEPVLSLTDAIIVDVEDRIGDSKKEIGYVTVTQITPVIKYTFSIYRDDEWIDWRSYDSVGVDAAAFVVTGQTSTPTQPDFQRNKQVPYLTVHSRKTETGFGTDINGDFTLLGSSSIIVQSMWEWTNLATSNKWGRPFQAYRHGRLWFPASIDDEYDDGHAVVTTKNKLRGIGRVVSIKFATEPKKNFHLYGWSLILNVAGNV